jgi:predicted CXXCH cytochrome family protein
MGRSFFRPHTASDVEDYEHKNTYSHSLSDRHYRMRRTDGRYYQRRWQTDTDGKEINALEREVHFVLGSGNHARTYLHRTPEGRLLQLPLGWYSARGGYWAMNPGYDRPGHVDFRREITFECLFCHTGYPEISQQDEANGRLDRFPGKIPEGIDCQRCHGPGEDHIAAAHRGAAGAIRASILNPARLSRERQLEVCMQCHLETTSWRLPHAVRRAGRGFFSYRPSEPLADYMLFFDYAAPRASIDRFEINHSAYRLRKSICFQKSAMTCTTCHDPHQPAREQLTRYTQACRSCHGSLSKQHPAAQNCAGCHMPKRRTDDVIHAVMTDHYIQRRPPGRDLLAPLQELHEDQTAYRGEVVLYYPKALTPGPESELHLAVAQVKEGSNVRNGILQLRRAIETHRPAQPEFYFELGEAYRQNGEMAPAVSWFEQALSRRPGYLPALRSAPLALVLAGRFAAAEQTLKKGLSLAPRDPLLLSLLGEVYHRWRRLDEAIALLREAAASIEDVPEAHNTLGAALFKKGDFEEAAAAFRRAIQVRPDFAEAHSNLASVFSGRGDVRSALRHLEIALRHDPNSAAIRFNYATTLLQSGATDKARQELEAALRIDPNHALARKLLADLQPR